LEETDIKGLRNRTRQDVDLVEVGELARCGIPFWKRSDARPLVLKALSPDRAYAERR
jgi:hypothetical protein